MRNRCKVHLLETKYVKMAQRVLDIELRKKFQGMEFRDFYESIAKVTEYENYTEKKVKGERHSWELIARRSILKKLQ